MTEPTSTAAAKAAYLVKDWQGALNVYEELSSAHPEEEAHVIGAVRCELQLKRPQSALARITEWRRRHAKRLSVRMLYEELRALRNLKRFSELDGTVKEILQLELSPYDRLKIEKFYQDASAGRPAAVQKEIGAGRSIAPTNEAAGDHPHDSEGALQILRQLLSAQNYEDLDALYRRLRAFYVANDNLNGLSRIALAAARPAAALDYAMTAKLSDKVLIADICDRLNVWFPIANDPDLSSQLRRHHALGLFLQSYVHHVSAELLVRGDDLARTEMSRHLFVSIAKELANVPEAPNDAADGICIVAMHAGLGGAPKKAMRLAAEMARLGHKVSIMFEADREVRDVDSLHRLQELGVHCVYVDRLPAGVFLESSLRQGVDPRLLKLLSIVRPAYKAKAISRLGSAIEALRPRIVHVIGTLDLQICAYFAARLNGVRRILLNPGMMRSSVYSSTEVQLLESEYHQHVLANILSIDSHFIFANNSQRAAADMEQWLARPAGSIPVLYNGVDIAPVEHRPWREECNAPKAIGVVGRIAKEKRPFLVIEAFRRCLNDGLGARLVFAGTGPLEPEAKKHAAKILPEGAYEFLGHVSDIRAFLLECDCVLLVSDGEGLPNALIEAQCLGVPVVSTDAGGSRETFEDGETGLIVEMSEASIGNGLRRVLTETIFGENARCRAAEYARRFSIEQMARNALEFYERMECVSNSSNI